ncbi:MAG TPA: serine/threonine-protein kinase [Gemmataceae bacterium]|nr:serine/threonine-protein kinase [Gemmataceae bacterium]
MSAEPIEAPDREQRLNEVLLAYVEAVQAGQAPDRHELLAAHPDLADDLATFFASHDHLDRLATSLRESSDEEPPSLAAFPSRRPLTSASIGLGQLGDFVLLREIGHGGMGIVYEAEQISLRRRVALKVLPFAATIDPRQLQRFHNEAQAAAQLHHTSIVPIFAVGCDRSVHYYAMQFIDGQSLAALITELRQRASHDTEAPRVEAEDATPRAAVTLSTERSTQRRRFFARVATLGKQAAEALEHAHQMGVIHRDIKPANLLLDLRGQLWVTDFGVAQFRSDVGLTQTGEMVGTLRYASPEQVLGRRGVVDARSDIYSLGATLYELLTLRPLFSGADRQELLQQITADEPLAPRAVDRLIPVELETIVLKALAKAPSERYATAQELADDLSRFLRDEPIRARRPTLLDRAAKWARRHRAVVVSALVVLLLAAGGLLAATLLVARAYDRERQKAAEASAERERAEESFRQARDAVDRFTQIAEAELGDNPAMQGVRRLLLEAALEYYQSFIKQRRDDPSIEAELKATHARVTRLLNELTTLQGPGPSMLLRHPGVHDDLRLSEQQRTTIRDLDERFASQRRETFGEFAKLSSEERRKRFVALALAHEKAYAEALTPAQVARLRQIDLQQRGAFAFLDTEVAKTLQLKREQRVKIRALLDGATFAMFEPRPREGGPPPFGGTRIHDAWRETQTKMLDVLTPDQKKKWKEMTGESFQGEWRPGPPMPFPPPP